MQVSPSVRLYGRRGCHLCEDARRLLEVLAPRLGFTVDELDIDRDADLLARFDLIVPVIAVGDVELARAPLNERSVEQRLRAALGGIARQG